MAWAAGFFDGEGSTFLRLTRRHKGGTTGKDYPLTTVEMSVAQVRPEPLRRFHGIVGAGKMGGPYGGSGNRRPSYRWNTAGRPSAARVLTLLWPYLSEPKKEQARRVWAELAARRGPKSPQLPALPEAA